MTTDTDGRYPSYNTILHIVFASLGGIIMGGVMFLVGYAAIACVALLTMIGATFYPWISLLINSLAWALILWLTFFFVSKPEFEANFTPRNRHTLVAAFTGGGMLPWIYLIFLLSMGSGIRSWRQFVAILIAPPLGYVIAAGVHAAVKGHYLKMHEYLKWNANQ